MAPQKGGQANKQKQPTPAAVVGSSNGDAKKPAAASRPAVVVPAIPLPYIRQASGNSNKQQQQPTKQTTNGSVPRVASSERFPVASLEAALIAHQSAAADETAMARQKSASKRKKASGNGVNGSHVEKPGSAATTTNGALHDKKNTNPYASNDRQNSLRNGNHGRDNHHEPSIASSADDLTNGIANITFGDKPHHHPAVPSSVQVSTTPSVAGDVESTVGSTYFDDSQQGGDHESTSVSTSQPQSATRLSHPPTDFMPSSRGTPNGHYLENERPSRPASVSSNFHAGHHMPPHQVNGHGNGIMFGGLGFPDSHATPSPAAPSGAFMPPPYPPFMNGVNGENNNHGLRNGQAGHHTHTDSSSTNFPGPGTPFRPGMDHPSGVDAYGQGPTPGSVQGPGYPPNLGRYGPPTPRSFHGSHASGEFNGVENSVPFPPPNGHGFANHQNVHPHAGPHMYPFFAAQPFTQRPNLIEAELMDSIYYFQGQFDSAELADCVLELKFSNGQHHSVNTHGHKLILARSPFLHQDIMLARARDPNAPFITIHTEDPYMRPDAWNAALQRLYLRPLFTIPPPMGPDTNSLDYVGDNGDRFSFCLGYAAAGHLLKMNDVLLRGLHIAASMINWNTAEEGLGFVFEGATQRHFISEQDGTDVFTIEFGYGRETRVLMGAITSFLINAFPANFELDTTVADPPKFARIPVVPVLATTSGNRVAPAIARGTSMRKPAKASRFSSIKFGDLPTALPEEDAVAPREPAQCSSQLSRILLNLPYDDIRYVLTSESNGASGWNTAQDRYHALADVVAEREVRRLRAVEAVRESTIPGAKEIQQRLSAPRRHSIVDAWDVLNWQEEVVQPNGAGTPRIIRTWIPQFAPAEEAEVDEPEYIRQPRESMV